ncbi:transporter associated domain-containing protein [Shouchella patagoniensis]|uniref:transporter associated domain-containing protein n=1 Tax=Shouchella patagoniensis TaxID=228576 RepID=UPI00099593ED|nr:transporter associated domain-containing protein [Shouchella patagoniensis]
MKNKTESEIICDGKIALRGLNNVFHTRIPEEEDNLAGFLLHQFGYLPSINEQLDYKDLQLKILEVDSKKVSRV